MRKVGYLLVGLLLGPGYLEAADILGPVSLEIAGNPDPVYLKNADVPGNVKDWIKTVVAPYLPSGLSLKSMIPDRPFLETDPDGKPILLILMMNATTGSGPTEYSDGLRLFTANPDLPSSEPEDRGPPIGLGISNGGGYFYSCTFLDRRRGDLA